MKRVVGSAATPKYALVERAILDAIDDGRYAPGAQIPGERALAESLGVAPMTLRQGVSLLVDRGVLERRRRVGTFVRRPQAAANIAFLTFHVPNLSPGTVPAQMFDALRNGAAGRGRQVRGMLMVEPYPSVTQLYDELRRMDVGVVGLLGFMEAERDLVRSLAELLPCVLLVKDLPGVSLPTARHDMAAAAEAMVDYFALQGRRRIGMGAFYVEHPMHIELSYAVKAALARRGLAVDNALWADALDPCRSQDEGTRAWLDRVLTREDRPDALILPGMNSADFVVRRLAQHGERVGDRLDVIPIHSGQDPRATDAPYPILNLDTAAVAQAGTQLLLQELEGVSGDVSAPDLTFAPELVPPHARHARGTSTTASERG